ncbi:MAG: tautomerase family protein [Beijerinckiaceae bacterium]
MPLVRISVPEHFTPERRKALSDAVHDAMVETINVPVADRFQIMTRHNPAELVIDPAFLDINRGADAVIVQITLRAGRSNDQKRALYARIVAFAAQKAAMRPSDIMTTLVENSLPDWSFGGGIAQYQPMG